MINKKVPENGKIMGIAINSSSRRLLLTRVEKLISDSVKFYIVTPNPELILMAQSDGKLKKALNSATLSVADGVGVAMAHKFINLPIPQNRILKLFVTLFQGLKVGMSVFFDKKRLMSNFEIIKGRQVFEDLISLSAKKGWRVFLLGGLGNEAEIASRKLQITNTKLQIRFNKGPMLGNDAESSTESDKKLESKAITQINNFKPELLFVAFGNPKQEVWIHKNLSRLNIGGAMAVGGTFRYIAGVSKLPPRWMAESGLEWLWRLVTEPIRFKRIFNAFPIFPLKIWMSKLH